MNRLRELRRRAYLTQEQLAKRAGITGAAVCYIESGKSYPQLETQKKIAAALRVEPEVIFDEPPLLNQCPLSDTAINISCRRCHGAIAGLMWNPVRYELIVKKMPRPARIHSNGFFYHEDCLKEKLRLGILYPDLIQK
jgi:transcriptional regulator with XRE-family HTH domain